MNYKNETLREVSRLRLSYENEIRSICEKYEAKLLTLENEKDRLSRADYYSDIISHYKSLGNEISLFCKRYADMRAHAPKLNFDFKKALTSTPSRPFPKGEVDGYVKKIEKEAEALVEGLSASKTVAEDEPFLKTLAAVNSDFKYITENARRLLDESGIPERRKREALFPIEARINDVRAEYENALRTENLECYSRITELRDECSRIISRKEKEKLGAYTPSAKEKLSVLIGYEKNEIDKSDADFIERIFGFPGNALSETPIYYCPEDKGGAIVINAHEDFFKTARFSDILENVFFAFISNLPKSCLKMTGIDCGLTPKIAGLAKQAREVSANITDTQVLLSEHDISRYAGTLYAEAKDRSINIENIFDYNRKQKHSPESFKLVFANEYPSGFSGYRETSKMHLLKYLSEFSVPVGIIPIICQDADSDLFDERNAPRFTESDAEIFIDLTGADSVKINGREASLDVRCSGFSEDEYWEELKDYYNKNQDIFYLDEVLRRDDAMGESLWPSFNIEVPLGIVDDKTFKYTFKAGDIEHTLILGGSDKGKSSLLHALILSMAYCYTPEEVEFYLADFKVGSTSPEFSNYEKIDGVANLYVPHVKYLQSRCTPSDALDMFATIKNLYEQRTNFILNHDANDYCSYHDNNIEKIKSGILPKIPMTFFIIDEYHRLVEAAEEMGGDFSDRIVASIKGLIDTIRSAGIALVLVDQDMKRITSSIFGNGNNMPNRIVIGGMENSIIKKFFYSNAIYPDEAVARDAAFLADENFKGRIMIGGSQSHTNLRVAFVGKASSDKARALAAKIREKHSLLPNGQRRNSLQILGGSEKSFPVTDDMESYRIAHQHKIIKKLGVDKVEDFSLAIGVSSTGGAPIRLEYEQKQNRGPGYTAVAGEEALAAIVRNTIFAFLYRTAGVYSYSGARIEYCAKPSDSASALGMFASQNGVLEPHVNVIGNFVSMSRAVLRLSKLYDEREAYADSVESTDFEPLLLVIHNADWVGKAKSLPNPDAKPQKKEVHDDQDLRNKTDEANEMLKSLGLGDVILPSAAVASFAADEKKEDDLGDEFEFFTASELKEALKKLYLDGNRYNIYVLLGSQGENPIGSIFSDGHAIMQNAAKHSVYASDFEDKPPEFCFVTSSHNKEGSKTRLYDYNPEKQGAFWKELNEKLNGGLK